MTLLQKIKSQIQELPSEEKAKLVDFMLKREPEIFENEVERAWAKEMQARYESARSGKMKFYPAEAVLKEARRKLT